MLVSLREHAGSVTRKDLSKTMLQPSMCKTRLLFASFALKIQMFLSRTASSLCIKEPFPSIQSIYPIITRKLIWISNPWSSLCPHQEQRLSNKLQILWKITLVSSPSLQRPFPSRSTQMLLMCLSMTLGYLRSAFPNQYSVISSVLHVYALKLGWMTRTSSCKDTAFAVSGTVHTLKWLGSSRIQSPPPESGMSAILGELGISSTSAMTSGMAEGERYLASH